MVKTALAKAPWPKPKVPRVPKPKPEVKPKPEPRPPKPLTKYALTNLRFAEWAKKNGVDI